ncbi:MAG TPA: Flp pilus assembly protein CpaB [Rhizomicrobium sp.]|jgi:pilus assembly protein CpaB
MNTQRALVVGGAVVAACIVALVVRGFLGGGTQPTQATIVQPKTETSEVLVASSDLQPGTPLTPDSVRWQAWPRSSVDDSFITQESTPNLQNVVQGAVVRAPIVKGEPLTNAKFVHSDSAGFMAATLAPGMRAVSVPISAETGAGGFILPNDRVDVIVTVQNGNQQHSFRSFAILTDIRVLAVDQTSKQEKDQTVMAKTATLELSPAEAVLVSRAQASGTISLALRPLSDTSAKAIADRGATQSEGNVVIIRYGLAHGDQKE